MITTYSDFLTHLGKLVTFDGENPGDASIGTLETVLTLAQTRLYRELETSHNEKELSGTITDNKFELPTDFRSISVIHFGKKTLEPVSYEFLQEQLNSDNTGDTKYFARLGGNLMFAPAVADGTAPQGTYYAELPELSSDTYSSNSLVLEAPDVFLYACMVEAAPLYGFQDQLPIWEAKYRQAIESLNTGHRREAFNAGRMMRRNSTKLLG